MEIYGRSITNAGVQNISPSDRTLSHQIKDLITPPHISQLFSSSSLITEWGIYLCQLTKFRHLKRRIDQPPPEKIDRLLRIQAITDIRALDGNHPNDR